MSPPPPTCLHCFWWRFVQLMNQRFLLLFFGLFFTSLHTHPLHPPPPIILTFRWAPVIAWEGRGGQEKKSTQISYNQVYSQFNAVPRPFPLNYSHTHHTSAGHQIIESSLSWIKELHLHWVYFLCFLHLFRKANKSEMSLPFFFLSTKHV